jgi:Spy/CpxP family protein refolding chaperone
MNKKARLWIIFSFLAVLAAGIAGGLFLGRSWHRGGGPSRSYRSGPPPSLDRLAKDLDLTPAQKEEIKKIFERNEERLKELRSQIHANLSEVRSRLKTEIDSVLTPQQREKFNALLERHMRRERETRRRDPDRPSSPPDEPKGEHP